MRSTRPRLLPAAVLAAATMLVVTLVGLVLQAAGRVEMPVSAAFNAHHTGVVGALGDAFYHAFGPAPAIVGTTAVTAVILLATRDVLRASTFAFTVAATWLSVAACKLLVHRHRPVAGLLPHPFHPAQVDASYPSGHAAFVSAIAVTAALMSRTVLMRTATAVLGAGAMLTAGTLLAIDGVHYPTDVLASMVWVVGVAPLVHLVWTRVIAPRLLSRLPRRWARDARLVREPAAAGPRHRRGAVLSAGSPTGSAPAGRTR